MWDDMMRRILQPVEGISPHVTSPYGAETGRPRGSSNPHRGIDFNYVGGQSARLNTSHPELRSPVNGVVERAGDDQWGTISIRDNNGLRHQILHTNSRKVKVGDVVAAGQVIGTMGNTGLSDKKGNPGHHHVHYQIKDLAGNVLDPGAFADALGPFDPVPAPAYIPEYKRYLQNADMMPRSRSKDVRVLRRMPAGNSDRSAFDSNDPAPIPAIPPDASFPSSPQSDFEGRYGKWPSPSGGAVFAGFNQVPQRQSDAPGNEEWPAMWRRRTGLP
ncbi:M23 family metallopeptidase [Bradyrhizobium yuanmingense]|uniref:M23 family metallopeptidase n=1 Tax=Bradyrhizobium yuanmingense TaxID=108015 RepID=UPI0009E714FA|nr:M23 family metallopeptidase [Bradyrhizobium yuanmingense]